MNRVVRNSKLLGIAYTLTKFINYFWGILIARLLTVNEFGLFSFFITVGGFADTLSDLGTSNYIIRIFSKQPKQISTSIIYIFLIRTTMFIVFFFIGWGFVHQDLLTYAIVILAFYLQNMTNMLIAVFRASERMEFESVVIVLNRISLLVLTALLSVMIHVSVMAIIVIMLLSNLIGFVYLIYIYFKKVGFSISFDFKLKNLREILKGSLPFALTIIFTTIYFRIDILFLEKMKTSYDVGIYSSAYKFVDFSIIVPMILVTPILPFLVKTFDDSKPLFDRAVRKYNDLLGFIGASGLLFLDVLAKPIITFTFGAKYSEAILILVLLSYFMFFQFSNYIIEYSLNASGKQRYVNYNALVGIVVNLGLNFILIPAYGAMGAAIATVVTALVMNLFNLVFMKKVLGITPNSSSIYLFLFVTGLLVLDLMNVHLLILKAVALIVTGCVTLVKMKNTLKANHSDLTEGLQA